MPPKENEHTRNALEQWLKHAPSPIPLQSGQQYHVFLSYRSVQRQWVLQLYDILRHLGYQVFLDQFVIAAGDRLVGSLSEALAKSASAVLIWSREYTDSAWCREEYETMERRHIQKKGFYVTAKLDSSPLPEFAANTTYIDFSDQCEGPTGTGLLRLLYGLRGEALPDAAVRLAAEVDDEMSSSLIRIKAARDVGDATRLLQLSLSDGLAWLSSPVLSCEVADALIALSLNDEALQVLERIEKSFPKAVRPKQLRGLALARKKDWQTAQTIFSELYQAGEMDPETLGMYARTWMDRYNTTKNRQHLEKSRDLYLQAFRAVPSDYYTGINAAAKSVFLGDLELGKSLATEVEAIVGSVAKPKDYWKTATMAEVQLIKQDYANAARLYRAAISDAPEERGSHRTSYDQVQVLLEQLKPPEADRSTVLQPFSHLV
jgi:tetratricopeptide (TPR) repeat protein